MYSALYRLQLTCVLGICTLLAYGQGFDFQRGSNSKLISESPQSAMTALSSERNSTSVEEYQLKDDYLSAVVDYSHSFDENFYKKADSLIALISDCAACTDETRRAYLYHYISYFPSRLFSQGSYIEWCNRGLTSINGTSPLDRFFEAQFLVHRAHYLTDVPRPVEAIRDLHTADQMTHDAVGIDPSIRPKILFLLGFNYNALENGQIGKGYEYLLRAEEMMLSMEHPDTLILVGVYGILSDIAWGVGDIAKGKGYVERYKSILQKTSGDYAPLDIARGRYHLYYKEMQMMSSAEVDQARAIIHKAAAQYPQYQQDNQIRLRMTAMYNLMGEIVARSDPNAALPYYQKAMSTYKDKWSTYYLQALFNLGKNSLYGGDAKAALSYSKELIAIAEDINDANLPFFYFLKALAHIKLDNFDSALSITHKVIEHMDPQSNVNLREHSGLGTFAPQQKRIANINLLSRMGVEFEKGFDTNEAQSVANALFQLGIREYDKSIKAAKVTPFTMAMYKDLAHGIIGTRDRMRSYDLTLADMIEFSENTSDKYLWTMHKENSDPNLYFDQTLLDHEAQLRSEMMAHKQQYLIDSSHQTGQAIFDIELQLEKLEQKKRRSNSPYYDFEEREFRLTEYIEYVTDSTLILKYEFVKDSLYLYTIRSTGYQLYPIGNSDDLSRMIHEIYELISTPTTDIFTLEKRLDSISVVLLPGGILEDTEELVIRTDGGLSFLPFDVLRHEGQYLVKLVDISYVSSLAFLTKTLIETTIESPLVIAPSYTADVVSYDEQIENNEMVHLAGAQSEASNVAAIIAGETMSGETATKANFLAKAEQHDLLHFAMHSILDDSDPELTHLAFHDDQDAYRLYINELYGLRLPAHMVVLSACNTGYGKQVLGDGVVSLNRAFTYAGVSSVIASLWNAPDNTTESIVVSFYENLDKGQPKHRALRNARLEYLKNVEITSLSHPFYWASLVPYGDTSPLMWEKRGLDAHDYAWMIGLALTILLYIGFRHIQP